MDIAASKEAVVQVGHFGLSDLLDLLFGDGGYLVLVGNAGSLVNAASLLDENRRGRGLGDESERTILINGDHYGNDQAGVVLGSLVKVLGESHDVYTVLTESRANRGQGSPYRPGSEV